MNARLLEDFLYLKDRGKVSSHNSIILLDPLKRRLRRTTPIETGLLQMQAETVQNGTDIVEL